MKLETKDEKMPNRNRTLSRTRKIVAGLGIITLTLTGCTTGRHNGQSTNGTSTNVDTLRINLPFAPTTLDPARVEDLPTGELFANIFEPLTRFDDQNHLQPCLAEKWDISPDSKTYTFHIRPGVKFHNGRELVASDVKYSWERALNPTLGSPVAANYLDGIVGIKDVLANRRSDLPGVVVSDPHTLKVTIDRPRGYFLSMLSYPTGFVVCKEAIDSNGGKMDEKSMIGTGPYKVDNYSAGTSISLLANDAYWGDKPKTPHIEMPFLQNPDTSYNNFRTDNLDLFVGVPATRYSQDQEAHTFNDEYHRVPVADVDYLVMQPVRQPAFAKVKVRQAFAAAIDRDSILKVAYHNIGKRADGMLPPELPGVGDSPPPISFDPAKAKQLLTEAGYPGGKGFPTLTLIARQGSPVAEQVSQMIRSNLKDNLAIEVNLQSREASEFFKDASKENMEFYLAGWIADYPDPQDFLSTLLMSSSSLDHSKYKNPEFDGLCTRADSLTDLKVRATLYSKANKILMDDVGVLPIAFVPRIILAHKNVSGWQTNLCSMLPQIKTVKLGNKL